MIFCGAVARMRGIPPFGENKKSPRRLEKIQCLGRMDELMRLYRQKRSTLGQQGRFHSFVGEVSHWGENGAYWGGQAAKSLLRKGFYRLRKEGCETIV